MKLGLNPSYSGVAKILPLCTSYKQKYGDTVMEEKEQLYYFAGQRGNTVGQHLRNCAPFPSE